MAPTQDPLPKPIYNKAPWAEPTLTSHYYTPSHHSLRDYARSYTDTHILPHHLDWEAAGTAGPSAQQAYARSGLAFTDVPSKYWPASIPQPAGINPDNIDAFHTLILADESARIEGGVANSLAGASVIGVPPLINYGTDAQKQAWLPGLFTWETSFCLGITEPSGGSDVANLLTTAEKSFDGEREIYIVNGSKKWITGALWATHMTTAVRTGEPGSGVRGISILAIPLSAAGVRITKIHNSGQNAGGSSLVILDGVRVAASNLIGSENGGWSIIMRNFNKERFLMAVACNRKARTCLSDAFAYAGERETFGKPLLANQVIRRKFAEVAHRMEAHWAWLEAIAWSVKMSDEGWWSEDIAGRIALAKVQGAQILELAAREAQQVFGGAGYQRGGDGKGCVVEQISRDLRVMVVGGGSEEILEDLAVRQESLVAGRRGWKL